MDDYRWHLPWLLGALAGILLYFLNEQNLLSDNLSTASCVAVIVTVLHLQLACPKHSLLRWCVPSLLIGGAYLFSAYHMSARAEFNTLLTLFFPLPALISTSFHQVYTHENRAHFPYQQLFYHAWNTPLILLIASVFAVSSWGLATAWASLFSAIGMPFLTILLSHKLSLYLLLSTAVGLAISLIQQYEQVIITLRLLCLGLLKALYIPVIFLGIFFFLSLPFAELDTTQKWPTIFAVNGVTLLLFNAVYQDGKTAPFSLPLLKFANACLWLLLPLTVAVGLFYCANSLSHHGVTEKSLQGLLYGFILLIYALSYAIATLKKPFASYTLIPGLNILLAPITGILLFLMTTPILDPEVLAQWLS